MILLVLSVLGSIFLAKFVQKKFTNELRCNY